jgi:hypothetical protein
MEWHSDDVILQPPQLEVCGLVRLYEGSIKALLWLY